MLALLLLLSQQMALSHAVTHLSSPVESGTRSDDPLPSEMQCIKCFAFASVGAALGASLLPWFINLAYRLIRLATPVANRPRGFIRAYHSRAPPLTV